MILYFSGTGNTKYCAQKIAESLGIISPTYDYNLPWVVIDYLKELKIKNLNSNIYTYGVFTCGGKKSGMCAKTLENVLKEKNRTLRQG